MYSIKQMRTSDVFWAKNSSRSACLPHSRDRKYKKICTLASKRTSLLFVSVYSDKSVGRQHRSRVCSVLLCRNGHCRSFWKRFVLVRKTRHDRTNVVKLSSCIVLPYIAEMMVV